MRIYQGCRQAAVFLAEGLELCISSMYDLRRTFYIDHPGSRRNIGRDSEQGIRGID